MKKYTLSRPQIPPYYLNLLKDRFSFLAPVIGNGEGPLPAESAQVRICSEQSPSSLIFFFRLNCSLRLRKASLPFRWILGLWKGLVKGFVHLILERSIEGKQEDYDTNHDRKIKKSLLKMLYDCTNPFQTALLFIFDIINPIRVYAKRCF